MRVFRGQTAVLRGRDYAAREPLLSAGSDLAHYSSLPREGISAQVQEGPASVAGIPGNGQDGGLTIGNAAGLMTHANRSNLFPSYRSFENHNTIAIQQGRMP
jgi:hypothetical protein